MLLSGSKCAAQPGNETNTWSGGEFQLNYRWEE